MQAAILAQLCDNLLDLRTIRNEIERRETEGHWVAGHGGEGGICPMRSLEERARRNNPETDENGKPVSMLLRDHGSSAKVICCQLCACTTCGAFLTIASCVNILPVQGHRSQILASI